MQILVMPRMLLIDMRADTHIRVQNITMLILMSFVNDFNIKYIIRLVSWIYTTPVLLNNVLQNNKKCLHIIFLHELAYMIELMIVIFKMPIYFECFVYMLFLIILAIYLKQKKLLDKYNSSVTQQQEIIYVIGEIIYDEFLVILWIVYGIVRLAYVCDYISSYTEWILFNVLDAITKSLYFFMKKLNLELVKKNSIVSKQIQQNYTRESLLYIQPYLYAAIHYDDFISLPKQVNKLENVIVIFFDLIGYTEVSSKLTSNQITNVLSELYSNIDSLLVIYSKVKKVETVGDEYMAVISLENEVDITECVVQSILFVKHSIETITQFKHVCTDSTNNEIYTSFLGARAGLHTGLVTKAIVGLFMPRTQYFGSVINIGSRMENTGKPNMIRVTSDMMQMILKCDLDIPSTEEWIEVKGIGIMQTYIIDIRNIDKSFTNSNHSLGVSSLSSKHSSFCGNESKTIQRRSRTIQKKKNM